MKLYSLIARMRAWLPRRFPLAGGRSIIADRRGNVLVLTALALPAILAALGLGFESANWYQMKHALQNAADSAAIAAASNGTVSGFATEAMAVSAQYGFQNGVARTTIAAQNNVACPAGTTNCYSVTISRPVPLLLAKLVGYSGNATINGAPAQLVTATAIATPGTSPRNYCILALSGSGAAQGIRTNGAPKADLMGCNVMSNSDAQCNGHNLNAGNGDAHGSSSGCGTQQNSNMPVATDPYTSLASNIPPNPCSSYPQEPVKKNGTALPAGNQFSGNVTWPATKTVCGDVQLTGNVTVSTPAAGTVLVIENGQFDPNGYTFQTASGSALTIVFSGDNSAGYTHAPSGGGTIDIAAPTTGAWSGVALYQDPSLTSGVDISAAGNSPTWDITGLVYLPHSSVTFSGAVNRSSNGQSCFVMVVDNVTINGTGSILSQQQCAAAGLIMPTNRVPSRGQLVQ